MRPRRAWLWPEVEWEALFSQGRHLPANLLKDGQPGRQGQRAGTKTIEKSGQVKPKALTITQLSTRIVKVFFIILCHGVSEIIGLDAVFTIRTRALLDPDPDSESESGGLKTLRSGTGSRFKGSSGSGSRFLAGSGFNENVSWTLIRRASWPEVFLQLGQQRLWRRLWSIPPVQAWQYQERAWWLFSSSPTSK